PQATTRTCPSLTRPSQSRAIEFECSLGTITRRPPSRIGRVVAALWLVFGVASVAYLTSSLTSVMTATTLPIHPAATLPW
ncbi:MAG: hypothetical protein ACKOTD_12115, partial [Phycisphaerales bacterium]